MDTSDPRRTSRGRADPRASAVAVVRRASGAAVVASAIFAAPACELAFPIHDSVSDGAVDPCAQPHRFCATFDDGPLSAYPAYVPFSEAGGRLFVDTTDARSAPGSLVATCDTLPASSMPAFAFIAPKLDGPLSAMHLAFDMKIDMRGSAGNPIATIGVLDASNQLYNVQLAVGGDGRWAIGEYRPTAVPTLFSHPSNAMTTAGWMKVQLDVSVGGGDDFAALTVDGLPILAHERLMPSLTVGAPVIAIGFTSLYGPSTPWTVRFDNVTFDN